jgi:tetratricopeptide (TPR) repeat protein
MGDRVRGATHLLAAATAALLLVPLTGEADTQDELAAFQLAMNAYDTGEYETARQRFAALLEKDPPLKNQALELEIHKYLGATLMFLGRVEEAEAQFEAVLRQDPDYELDPVLFPTEVLDAFTRVKVRIADELAAIQEAKAAAAAQAEAEKEARRKALEQEIREAAQPVYVKQVTTERHVLLALLPFGIGQFQNGQDLKGWLFFGGEVGLLVANVTLYVLTEVFRDRAERTLSTRYINTAESYWTATNVVAGLTVAAVLAGIIDALIYYVKLGRVENAWDVVDEEEVPDKYRPPAPDLPLDELDTFVSLTFTWRL